MYLTNDEYINMGSTLELEDEVFARLEMQARRAIDRATHWRVQNENPVRESVKYCMYDLISTIYADENLSNFSAGRDIASMSNDGVSISFASSGSESAAQSMQTRLNAIIRTWLTGETTASGIHLLYAGGA